MGGGRERGRKVFQREGLRVEGRKGGGEGGYYKERAEWVERGRKGISKGGREGGIEGGYYKGRGGREEGREVGSEGAREGGREGGRILRMK